jgi:RNA polymerase sigma-70 factor (ECF subfamily)
LFGIATNLIRDHRRAERRQFHVYAEHPSLAADDGIAERMDAQMHVRVATQTLRTLSRAQRDVLLLLARVDLTPAEIATALDMPAATVRSHLSRARSRMPQALEPANYPQTEA